MVSLRQIIPALSSIGADSAHIETAVAELTALLSELDEVSVKGRQSVDTLLGCMMAIDAIIGGDNNS